MVQQMLTTGCRMLQTVPRMAASRTVQPILAVIGTTGSGKSQLAVDLALRFNGEVINADAVQMYNGLPIITNKITVAERKGVPHHLLDCIGLHEQSWRVGKFVTRALEIIQDIRQRGRLPIVVGGTHYYVQSLLFNDTLAEEGEQLEDIADRWPILNATAEEMLQRLREIDPVMAERWHPNDARKIRRSLEIYYKVGKPASELYADQQARRAMAVETQEVSDEDELNGIDEPKIVPGLRFPTLFLWTHTPRDILKERLRLRVDQMAERGLVREAQSLKDFAHQQELRATDVDQSRGIYISIGYKEFIPYLKELRENATDNEAHLKRLMANALEETKSATWRYAKYQERWIRIKLLNALKQANVLQSLLVLDTSKPQDWATTVHDIAVHHVQNFLDGGALPEKMTVPESVAGMLDLSSEGDAISPRRTRTCQTCNVSTTTENEWLKHINSNRHRKCVKAKAKKVKAVEMQEND